MSLILIACSDGDNENEDVEISTNGERESHHIGMNCLNCHNGGGLPVFTAAGTVYQVMNTTLTLPNVRINFHSGPNATGTLEHTIEVDALGNFYTTETIAWGSGLYLSVTVPGGATTSMSFAITNGACGSCHGNSEVVIFG